MATRKSNPTPEENLPISKQTAGGVAGAVVGSAVAGPVGAIVGAVAGTMMGNRAAKGKSLVSTQTVQSVKGAAAALKAKVDSVIPKLPGSSSKARPTQGNSSKKGFSDKESDRPARKRPKSGITKKAGRS